MAEPNGNGDSGSKDRATVALVDSKVDGIRDLLRAEFANIKERIEPLTGLIATTAKLEQRHEAFDMRVTEIERDNDLRWQKLESHRERTWEWRRGVIWGGTLFALGGLVNIAITFHWL